MNILKNVLLKEKVPEMDSFRTYLNNEKNENIKDNYFKNVFQEINFETVNFDDIKKPDARRLLYIYAYIADRQDLINYWYSKFGKDDYDYLDDILSQVAEDLENLSKDFYKYRKSNTMDEYSTKYSKLSNTIADFLELMEVPKKLTKHIRTSTCPCSCISLCKCICYNTEFSSLEQEIMDCSEYNKLNKNQICVHCNGTGVSS